MEDAIEQIVAFFKHAAQGLEEKKQILYLLGPVGGGKSSIAERLKSVMESHPIYALKGSPVNESPLGLFPPERFGAVLEEDYGIPRRYLTGIMSPWAIKRLQEFGGDLSQVPRRAHQAVGAAPGGDHQDRAGRREQPGHLARWSARSTSASSSTIRRTIRTPTATRAACASPTRACSSSSRCSRRRSRCCIRC